MSAGCMSTTVHMRDGSTIEGQAWAEPGGGVVVDTGQGLTPVHPADVQQVDYAGTPMVIAGATLLAAGLVLTASSGVMFANDPCPADFYGGPYDSCINERMSRGTLILGVGFDLVGIALLVVGIVSRRASRRLFALDRLRLDDRAGRPAIAPWL